MFDFLTRAVPVLGEPALKRLRESRVALLGLGGVGGSAAEALVRLGVGHLLLVDGDTVDTSNRNRQLLALTSTEGQPKTQAAADRLLGINPSLELTLENRFVLPENAGFLFDYCPDLVLDAVDTVTLKLYLAEQCYARGIPLLSSMGTGNRFDPTALRLGDIAQTAGNGCPLARVIRRELRKRAVPALQVVYSIEPPARSVCTGGENGRHSPGSTALVPPVAGYLLAYGALLALAGGLLPEK